MKKNLIKIKKLKKKRIDPRNSSHQYVIHYRKQRGINTKTEDF